MIGLEDRQSIVALIDQACAAGASQKAACELAGLEQRSLQRWRCGSGLSVGDARAHAPRRSPSHRLSEAERAQVLSTLNEPRFADQPPAFIVATLADEGVYLASESSFYRIMREHGQNQRRGRAQAPRTQRPPTTHIATAAGQVWCWDVTYLPSTVKGLFFYLYVILDIYSRKIVGWEVHGSDSADHAVQLLRRTALAEGIAGATTKPVLHGDNGATLKATTVLAMLHWLGIAPSYSRPRVSNDNAYAESVFRTAKYRPQFPSQGVADVQQASQWGQQFVHWYNEQHLHSGIGWVTPSARHAGQDEQQLRRRREVYAQVREKNRQRWSKEARAWKHQGAVTLNPERDSVVSAAVAAASNGPDLMTG